MKRLANILAPVALFALLTAIMTWPQVTKIGTAASPHQDVYFNMWRFGWVAHALTTSPAHLLDGNIFYPEPRTLTFSDAMPVEALIAAPLLLAGTPPVLVHNLLLLAGIILSAAGICVLARELTGSAAAGVTAGIVFAFVPYRFEHYMHMELQWTVWTPWAFWALHRALRSGSRRYGALAARGESLAAFDGRCIPGGCVAPSSHTAGILGRRALPTGRLARLGATPAFHHGLLVGIFVALQFMSSVYYGVFLGTLLGFVALVLLCGVRGARLRSGMITLATAGMVTVALSAPYAVPYMATKKEVGGRPADQVARFSAKPASYTVATDSNYLYGAGSAPFGRAERRLFTGIVPLLLAVAGLLLRPPSDEAIAYLLGLVAAFEMSLGLYGYSYTFLYHHVLIFDGLRAPARLGIFVVFFLAVLAAYGHAALEQALSRTGRLVIGAAICACLMLEYWVAPVALVPFPNRAPPLHAWLASQPRGVVAEFPMPVQNTLPGDDPRYAYLSTFHWMPSVNGYSGYYPPSYLRRLERLRHFPDDRATAELRLAGVRYVIVHQSSYLPDQLGAVQAALSASSSFIQVAQFSDGQGQAAVFKVR